MEEKTKIIKDWLGTGSINIFGRPFAGKDTQGKILADLVGGRLVGGGDILRSHKDPQKIEQIMASGGIIPSDFYFEMVLPFLSQDELKNIPLILSAVGRSSGEETTIMKATTDSGHPIKAVVLIQMPEIEVLKRFDASGKQQDRGDRTDDNKEVLMNRLAKFQEKTIPVIDYYRKQGLLVEVDGTNPREQVTQEIIDKLAVRTVA